MAPYGPSRVQYSFGPGPISPAVRALLIANIGVFVITLFAPSAIIEHLGLMPAAVIGQLRVWQLVTYLFIHSPSQLSHILFNMLALWMFGVDLERRWGTRSFMTYYMFTGIAAGLSMIAVSLLPFDATRATYSQVTIGASGAVYGLLMAWAMLFPHRQILFMMIFPVPARVFVAIMGAIAFFSAVGASGGPVANVAHLGGLLFGYVYLKGPANLRLELQYRMTRWRMERMRRKFSVHKGGRDDWEKRIH